MSNPPEGTQQSERITRNSEEHDQAPSSKYTLVTPKEDAVAYQVFSGS